MFKRKNLSSTFTFAPSLQTRILVLLLVPQVALCFGYRHWPGHGWAVAQLGALGLGVCLGFGWTLGSRPRMFALLLSFNALVLVFLGGYSNVFGDLPSLYSLAHEVSEGMATTSSWLLFLPWLLVGTIIPTYFGVWALGRRVPALNPRILLFLTLGWGLLQAGTAWWPHGGSTREADARRQILGFWGASIRDYWAAYLAADDSAMVQRVIEDRVQRPPMTLGRATPLHRRVLVLQLESMDLRAISHRYDGQWVTPFLRELSEAVPPIWLEPNHRGPSGSSGSDFQLLTGLRPVANKPAFSLNRMDWAEAGLPRRLRKKGYPTFVFHGNDGGYWSRRRALAEMDVDRFFERRDVMAIPDTHWGASDKALFAFMRSHLEATPGPLFAFGITMTSHTPFHYAPPEFTSKTDTASMFFNSLHYLDGCLKEFLIRLQGGEPWTVVLYGDHASRVRSKGYDSMVDGEERVPLWVFSWDGQRGIPVEFPDLASEHRRSGRLEIASLFDFLAEQLPSAVRK